MRSLPVSGLIKGMNAMLDWSDTATHDVAAPPRLPLHMKLEPVHQTGLDSIDRSGGRVSIDEKRMINCVPTSINCCR
jgi:hypothetical protein